jgi:serine/threonine protein kinase
MDQEPGERPAFLAAACGADVNLREEVAALIVQSVATRNLPQLTAAEPVPDSNQIVLEAGMRLGPYKIVGALGEGGMGKVYRAVDTRLERAVAVKISAERFSERFVREARTISALNHPNICMLFDVGTLPSGDAFMVTELVEGETLRQWLSHSPGIERGLAVIGQVADALRAAHQAGIVHRDLKPANIMVRFDGYVKVLDFGLAKRC